ncbi:MAG: phosphatidylserine decarboxylase [Alphaproteobacteria bacterium]
MMFLGLKIRIHPEGYLFVFMCAIFALFSMLFLGSWMTFLSLLLTGWCAYFFRDPERVEPVEEGAVVSPADGVVQMITQTVAPKELNLSPTQQWTRVSIFLNIFDVHVNRIPFAGKIHHKLYYPGKFLNASLDKASEFNERNSLVIDLEKGQQLICTQIAGLIARRIVCNVREGDLVKRGDSYGIIRFGSRVDLYLPEGWPVLVKVGQRMLGGESVISKVPKLK